MDHALILFQYSNYHFMVEYSQISQKMVFIFINCFLQDQKIIRFYICIQMQLKQKQIQSIDTKSLQKARISKKYCKRQKMDTKELKHYIIQKMKGDYKINIKKCSQFQTDILKICTIDIIICPICLLICFQPITTICRHTYCRSCFDNFTINSYKCPICRENVFHSSVQINESVSKTINKLSFLADSSEKLQYQKNKERVIKQSNKRVINFDELNAGDFIDYRDVGNLKWFRGELIAIDKLETEYQLWIEKPKQNGDNESIDLFSSKSLNLAPANYFSCKKKLT